jgi:ABC-2 type transport system permease protein
VTFFQTKAVKLGDLSLVQMMWYLLVTESIMLSSTRVATLIDEDVRTGSLAMQLLRPVDYPFYRLSANLGERTVRFVMTALAGSVAILLLVGPLPVNAIGFGVFLLSLPLAFVLDFMGNFLVGIGAFWLEDTSGLLLLYSRITMILGGMLIPIELFPDWTQGVLKALPFSAMVYGPAKLLVHPELSFLGDLLLRQSIGILVFGIVIWVLYSKALKRIHSNGG